MDDDKLIPIEEFLGMIGMSRQWYYKHKDEPAAGLPQRIFVAGRPKLSLEECRAYIVALKRKRVTPLKRKRGRPRKDATGAVA